MLRALRKYGVLYSLFTFIKEFWFSGNPLILYILCITIVPLGFSMFSSGLQERAHFSWTATTVLTYQKFYRTAPARKVLLLL